MIWSFLGPKEGQFRWKKITGVKALGQEEEGFIFT